MGNRYESPQVLQLGKARDVIVGEKPISNLVESLGVPFRWEPDDLDDFDE